MIQFEENIVNLYAKKGKQWLSNLPILVAQLEKTYGLSDLKPFKNLSYNYVLYGFQDLQPIVLKLGLDSQALKQEASALKAFAGYGAVKPLLENDGILLLERAVSGNSLSSYFPENDKDAIQIICECVKQLHQAPIPSQHEFPHIKDWLVALDNELNIPTDYLQNVF